MDLSARAWRRRLAGAVATTLVVAAPAVALPLAVAAFQINDRSVQFDIKPQSLRQALLVFSEQAGVQLILTDEAKDLALRKALKGERTVTQALETLIGGTRLEYRFTGPNTVIVRTRPDYVPVAPAERQVAVDARKRDERKHRPAYEANEVFLEELITVGTRNRSRTVGETDVPIDLIGTESLRHTGHVETGRLLQTLAPSFNYTETTISDGTDIVRPATLRGLGPDQVLILVNGKRRHSQAWVNVQNTVGKGSVGTDMNTIPVAAIKRIEILRDGASAQYGSDAIAGVINVVLNDQQEGGMVTASWGQTYKGDGDTYYVAANAGLPLSENGFLNLTAEYRDKGPTNRAGPSSITGDVIMLIGDTDVEATSMMWNAEIAGDGPATVYSFGGFSDRNGLSGGFYRHPFVASRTVPQLYPDGFLPLQETEVTDFSQAIGFRYEGEDGWDYDLSATYGTTKFAFGARNTVNVSLASAAYYNGGDPVTGSPTSGYSGALSFDQLTVNFDASGGNFQSGLLSHLAYGFEFRDEQYTIDAGDPASYSCGFVDGEYAPSILNPDQVAFCGFQGFPGYSREVEGSKGRDSFALYIEAELEPSDDIWMTAAARYERYDETGDQLTGKLSARAQLSPALAIRAAASTGFRAPALAQRAFSSVITNTTSEGLLQTLIAPEGHGLPRTYGVDKLRHETSTNLSLGAVWEADEGVLVTLDAYRITIADRIVLGPTLLLPEGVSFGAIEAGSFFSNAIDTETWGVDLVACVKTDFAGGVLDLSTSLSWNRTRIQEVNAPNGIPSQVFFPLAERVNVEKGQPRFRANATADYHRGPFGALIRANFYGNTESAYYTAQGNGIPPHLAYDVYGLDRSPTTSAGSAVIVDMEVSYDVTENVMFAIGANNILNTYPDKLPNNALARWISEGRQQGAFGNFVYPWVAMPWGINGGYYYARVTVRF
ncbi:TonB-dependent receptor [Kordiimonas gwangyangensis]|uniref:TonB-dependent receptor n=1 Tax=Kordiimonas gwangyangensis TaxID=288022 RepID=UPI00037F52BA|nr:TonB-dependent receptor [Kordiimonas gwangyangensis]